MTGKWEEGREMGTGVGRGGIIRKNLGLACFARDYENAALLLKSVAPEMSTEQAC